MYTAILTSIESRENTWDASFDRFENILYSKIQSTRPSKKDKKWYCRDYNKPSGCTRQSPHKAQVGVAGITRTVIHMCATCWM